MSSYGLWLSTAGMKVNEHRQTLLANNMANASTTGFKHDLAVVTERRVQSKESPDGFSFAHPVLDGMAGGINVHPTFYSSEQGSIETTGRPLDVAIRGEGFFQVSDGVDLRYTRNGEFAMNTKGELILADASGNWNVLDDTGAPIVFDPTGERPVVSQDGTIRQGNEVVARIGLVVGEDPRALRKVGQNLFELIRGEMSPAGGTLISGAREASTFDPVQGLASMIEVSRAYQLNASMIQLQDQLNGLAASTIGRLA